MLPPLDKSKISVVPLRESGNDLEYWLKKSPIERLNAVEICRQMVYGESETTSRLQRVLEVAKLEKS